MIALVHHLVCFLTKEAIHSFNLVHLEALGFLFFRSKKDFKGSSLTIQTVGYFTFRFVDVLKRRFGLETIIFNLLALQTIADSFLKIVRYIFSLLSILSLYVSPPNT